VYCCKGKSDKQYDVDVNTPTNHVKVDSGKVKLAVKRKSSNSSKRDSQSDKAGKNI
jgi:hypothetical protein